MDLHANGGIWGIPPRTQISSFFSEVLFNFFKKRFFSVIFLTDTPGFVFEFARISLQLLIRRSLAEDTRFCFPCGVSIETVSEYSQYSDWREGK